MLSFVYLMGFVWGIVWAAFLQFVPLGQFLVRKRTWVTVVIGVGIDLLLAFYAIPWAYFRVVATIVALSAIGIVFRSLYNEWGEWGGILDAFEDAGANQDHLGLGGYCRRLFGSQGGLAQGDAEGKGQYGSDNDCLISDAE